MKKHLPTLLIVLTFTVGIGMIFYPDLSNWLVSRSHAGLIQEHHEVVDELDYAVIEEEFRRAREYNEALAGTNIQDPFMLGSGAVLPLGYTTILNNNGIMGVIDIPRINVSLPIRHGVSYETLERNIGHMDNTAFPIGGEGTHSVLTGHAGLVSARLFTDLEQLTYGDVFFISVLNKRLAFKVDQILVVWPHETEALNIVHGEELVTLITCTPYGINSHRLLVRGHRIPYTPELEAEVIEAAPGPPFNWRLFTILSFAILFLIALIIYQKRVDKEKEKKIIEHARAQLQAKQEGQTEQLSTEETKVEPQSKLESQRKVRGIEGTKIERQSKLAKQKQARGIERTKVERQPKLVNQKQARGIERTEPERQPALEKQTEKRSIELARTIYQPQLEKQRKKRSIERRAKRTRIAVR